MAFNMHNRHLLSLMHHSTRELRYLLDLSRDLKRAKYTGTEQQHLHRKNIALIFEKTSTRTRCAFEVAAYDQGANVTYIDPNSSQIGHKESMKDTARVLGRMYDAIEYRGFHQEIVEELAQHAGVPAFGKTDVAAAESRDDADPLTFGTGVVASFLARAIREPLVDIRLEHRVTALTTDADGAVTGLRAQTPDGEIVLQGPVVLATSTYDWNPELVEEFLGLGPDDFSSLAPTSLTGDGITMARAVGADVAYVPPTRVPIVPGWNSRSDTGVSNGPEYALPHCLMVDRQGRRFCDDSYWVTIVRGALNPEDRHLPFFLIWDEQHHCKYGLGLTPPGGDYPEEFVMQADDFGTLGAMLDIDGEELGRTIARFNEGAAQGEDPEFGRGSVPFILRFAGDPNHEPNPVLGPLTEPPFYGTRLKFVGTGIGSSGLRADSEGRVLSTTGAPITGLYAAGSVAALTTMGSGYNSGFALGRGLTMAYLIAQELVPIA